MADKSWTIKDFELLGRCGEGKMAKVFRAREKRSGKLVALKIFPKKPIDEFGFHHQARREVEIQYHLRHKHVLRLYAYFHDEKHLYLVLELAAGGSLFAQIARAPPSEARVRELSRQLALALAYMHARGVIHRDVKLENVLLDAGGALKLADFGWAVHCAGDAQRETYCGTVLYHAPEMAASRRYGAAIDVWAFGVVLYELTFATPPFVGRDRASTLELIAASAPAFPRPIGAPLAALILACLCKNAAERPSMSAVLAHEYYAE